MPDIDSTTLTPLMYPTSAELSTGLGTRRIQAALSVPCPSCAAASGTYCFEGGHGLCLVRWEKGLSLAQSRMRPGELEELAAAVRNAERDRRIREREPARQARGGRR